MCRAIHTVTVCTWTEHARKRDNYPTGTPEDVHKPCRALAQHPASLASRVFWIHDNPPYSLICTYKRNGLAVSCMPDRRPSHKASCRLSVFPDATATKSRKVKGSNTIVKKCPNYFSLKRASARHVMTSERPRAAQDL